MFRRSAVLEQANKELRAELGALRSAIEERERAEAASEAKSRFLATVSHEIRTPLGGILGLADLLTGTTLTREQQSYVAAIRTSGAALMTLIDDILDYARIEAGRIDLMAEPFDIRDLVEGIVELLAPRAQDKGLEIASRIGGDVPVRLLGDSHRLRQVLLNLTGNAVKFTDHGGVGVEVSRREDGLIVFSVADTGPGVPQSRRTAIFEEFEQADGSASRRYGGTGLGLPIANTLVGAMGGEIELSDRAGGGSIFAFTVPMPAVAKQAVPALDIPIRRRALIVSSTEFQPAYLTAALEERGVEVLRVESREEAEDLLWWHDHGIEDLFVDCGQGEADVRSLTIAAARAGVARRVLLFSPFERRAFGQTAAADYDAWLVKPIRDRSLSDRMTDIEAREPVRPAKLSVRPPARASMRVLLAEDNPVNALVARAWLERLGAEIVYAENGLQAWKEAEASLGQSARRFDLVLMDVCMPVLDGLEVTRRIRAVETRHGLPRTTIVATTADVFSQTRRECEQAGMDEVLIKPIHFGDLSRLVAPPHRLLASA